MFFAFGQVTVVLATQLLSPMNAVTCSENPDGIDDDGDVHCTDGQVNTYSIKTYNNDNGPYHFTKYSLVCLAIGLVSLIFFTPFLPRTKAECAEWKQLGLSGKFFLSPYSTGLASSIIAFVMVGYALVASVAVINPATACLAAFGGGGC